jgi:hypothetical protein
VRAGLATSERLASERLAPIPGTPTSPMGGPPPHPPPPPPGSVAEGQVCDPDTITEEQEAEAATKQLVCQRTHEEQEALMAGRFMNARKGELILSAGGVGLIGSLLRAVYPPQRYSHSGIMTRNYDEITHSTASEGRLLDYKVGTLEGTDGLRPDVLKYLWPGVITQSVEVAVQGESWVDPESSKSYSIASFSPHAIGATHNDQFEVVPLQWT